ncbi:MAG: aminopeptidase [Acidobacteria bacterium]|nr:aminopeptidase [Acidobacteriota bacterium]
MRSPALWKIAQKLARENMQLKPGERVCVVSDLEKMGLAEVFLDVAGAFDTDPVLVLMTARDQHGQEVPEVVAAAMEGADVVFQVVTHAMTHTEATKRALAAGARVLVLRGVSEDMMLHGAINADYQQIAVRCARLAEKMNAASTARVRTGLGTDLAMSLVGRQSLVLDGIIKGPGRFVAMPDGETAIVPLEGSAQGTLVVEHTMDGVGLLDEPIRMTVASGRVVSIAGGTSAQQLQQIVSAADANATNIAEFAIGTNPDARLIGNMGEDKKREGTVHIAIGDSHVIGGTVKSNIHLDGLLLHPTVELDGQLVVENGRLLV